MAYVYNNFTIPFPAPVQFINNNDYYVFDNPNGWQVGYRGKIYLHIFVPADYDPDQAGFYLRLYDSNADIVYNTPFSFYSGNHIVEVQPPDGNDIASMVFIKQWEWGGLWGITLNNITIDDVSPSAFWMGFNGTKEIIE